MRLLPDTGVLLRALADDSGLSERHRAALETAEEVVISAAVLWDIETRRAAGEIAVTGDVTAAVRGAGCRMLAVTADHVAAAAALPVHGAPLARLLVAQARAEGLVLASSDRAMRFYDVDWL